MPYYTATESGFAANGHKWTEQEVQRLCLSGYASTALNYRQNATEEGSLHEVEFISPLTLCKIYGVEAGKPLYLTAYIAASDRADSMPEVQGWQAALSKLQLGGERKYGFGRVPVASGPTVSGDWWLYG